MADATRAPITDPPVRRPNRPGFKLPARARRARGRGLRSIATADTRALAILAVGFGAIIVPEAIAVGSTIVAGEIAYGAALALLLATYLAWAREPGRRLLLALATLPIMRLLDMSLPALIVPVIDWYVLIGIPAFVAVGLVARRLGLGLRDLGIRGAPLGPQLTLAASGLVLGLPAYIILRPDPLVPDPTIVRLVVAAVVLGVFAGALEELLFRGLIQTVAGQSLARGGVLVNSAATALMYAASLNFRYVLFILLVAAFFGLGVRRTGSIAGTSAGHAILLFSQLVVWPLVLR